VSDLIIVMVELLPTSSTFSSLFIVRQYPSKFPPKHYQSYILSTVAGIHTSSQFVIALHR